MLSRCSAPLAVRAGLDTQAADANAVSWITLKCREAIPTRVGIEDIFPNPLIIVHVPSLDSTRRTGLDALKT